MTVVPETVTSLSISSRELEPVDAVGGLNPHLESTSNHDGEEEPQVEEEKSPDAEDEDLVIVTKELGGNFDFDDVESIEPPAERRLSRQLNLRGIWCDTPKRREGGLFRHGMRQSLGGAFSKYKKDPSEVSTIHEDELAPEPPVTMTPVIDGRELTIAPTGRADSKFTPIRLWNKEERGALPPDVLQQFVKAATGYVLPKNNKLSVPKVVTTNDNKFLTQVLNLQSQLKQLKAHMIQYDIYDVMTIVVPHEIQLTPVIERRTYNVLDDYTQLHPTNIANSCAWFSKWVTDRYVHENMALTLTLLQNNTDEALWNKCMERYEEYHPMEQGGPLMAFLILQRIQDSSEQALDHLKDQLKNLDISTLPGEDVDQAVSLIKSTYHVLQCSSTTTRSYVPLDLVKTVFHVFQTSTVPEFTQAFKHRADEIQIDADMTGTQPKWPPVGAVLTLATNSYRRLKNTGVWDAAVGGKVSAYPALNNPPTPRPSSRPPSNSTSDSMKCWNCDGAHHLKDCELPRNAAKIEANKKRWQAIRRARGKPRHKTSETGQPLVLNRNGYYVLDQRALRQQRDAATAPPATETTTQPQALTATNESSERVGAIRSAIRDSSRRGL